MRRGVSLFLTVLLLLQCFALSSCSKKNKYTSNSFDYFDTVTTVVGYEKDKKSFDAVSLSVMKELEEYHRLFDIYKAYDGINNLYTINSVCDGAHVETEADSRIIDMLSYAKEMYYKTDGRVNVAMGSVLSIWHDYREAGMNDPTSAELPPMELLQEAAQSCDIEDIIIDADKGTVFISDPDMLIDVGAIAKGYAVEKIAERLEKEGKDGYVINVGGNVRTIGSKGDGSAWQTGIENPIEETDLYLAVLELRGEALVTSGTYQRYYTVRGEDYHHIIDPETLIPSNRYLSVSVVSKNSAEADALSTALFCMDIDDGKRTVAALDGVFVMWVMPNGDIEYSRGFENYIVE